MAQNSENHRGSHAMIDICNFYGDEKQLGNLVFDLMIEAKHKELAVLDLYRKYPDLVPKKRTMVLKK